MSTPFYDREFTFHQPDGEPITLRGTGNQHHALFTTREGHPVVQDPASGRFLLARVEADGLAALPVQPGGGDPTRLGLAGAPAPTPEQIRRSPFTTGLPPGGSRWEARRKDRREALAASEPFAVAPQRPTVGTFVGLCLLIEFPDVPRTISEVEVQAFCNRQGYTGYGNNGSVRDYFHDNSDGKLTYTNLVAPYYRARQPRAYYTDETVAQPRRATELIQEALNHHLASGFDFGPLTTDGKGYVFALNVFYAGPCVNAWSRGLWPHCFHLDTGFSVRPGMRLYDYQITNMGAELTLGTFCHENGHMICDFPDLYDYGNESGGVGSFCLMCGGGNADPKNPVQVGAYLKHAAGWASTVHASRPRLSAPLTAGRNEFLLHRRTKTEYFILEARRRAGRDAALPGDGVAIWKVDEVGSNNNEAGTATHHYECALVQADGRKDLERRLNAGDASDLFVAGGSVSDKGQPNTLWWDGTKSGLNVREIRHSDGGFEVRLG